MELNSQKIKNEKAVKSYKDLEGMTTDKLQFGLWLVEHLNFFRKFIIFFLIAVSAISWSYSIYNFAFYIGKGMNDDESMIREMVRSSGASHNYVLSISAAPLDMSPSAVLDSGEDKRDFFTKISNPNKDYWGEFVFHYAIGNIETEKKSGFILPEDSKFIYILGQSAGSGGMSPQIVFDTFNWHRINAHEIADWKKFNDEHLDIGINDINFTATDSSGLSEKVDLNKLSFSVSNNSAYNYIEMIFIISLQGGQGETLVITKYNLPEFMSGQTKKIEMVWPGELPPVTDISIVPEINILRKDIYIKF